MNVKIKAWDMLEVLKQQDPLHMTDHKYKLVLLALIENGAIHADEVWNSEKLIEAFEQVMGDEYFEDEDYEY